MIDISTEQPITFAEAAKLSLRRRDGPGTHVATVHRWAAVGCRGIKLEFLQMGGIKCTSAEALGRFFARLTTAQTGIQASSRTADSRARAIQAAEAELDRDGV